MLPATPIVFAQAMATAALLTSTAILDCNPSLFWFDKWSTMSERFRSYDKNGERTIWIIGASSGIGQELACQMAASVDSPRTEIQKQLHLIISSRNQSKLEQLVLDLESPGCRVTTLPLDVTSNGDIEAAVKTLQNSRIVLDTVVLNAGFGHLTPAMETLPTTAEAVFRGNALWPMVLMPLLAGNSAGLFRQEPHIVATASVASYIPVPLSSTYCAAKHALLGYFRSLQAEEPSFCIQLVSPGPVETDFHQNHKQGRTTSSSNKPSRLKMPVQRCARLLLRAIQQRRSGEYWIATQPLLTLLYMNNWFPGLVQFLTGQVGPKRVDLWRRGKDLYDPQSWRE